MADGAASSSATVPDDLSVNISIVSPSTSVNAPLHFPNLLPSTTVAQVKQKIRDALDLKPSNEQQRLIHQGKLLSREEQTLLDVFGEQKVNSPYCISLKFAHAFRCQSLFATNTP